MQVKDFLAVGAGDVEGEVIEGFELARLRKVRLQLGHFRLLAVEGLGFRVAPCRLAIEVTCLGLALYPETPPTFINVCLGLTN